MQNDSINNMTTERNIMSSERVFDKTTSEDETRIGKINYANIAGGE